MCVRVLHWLSTNHGVVNFYLLLFVLFCFVLFCFVVVFFFFFFSPFDKDLLMSVCVDVAGA